MAQVVQAELDQYLDGHQVQHDQQGHQAVERNGFQPERSIPTGLGEVPVKVPKTRDRSCLERVFRPSLLPPYLKKAQRVEKVIP